MTSEPDMDFQAMFISLRNLCLSSGSAVMGCNGMVPLCLLRAREADGPTAPSSRAEAGERLLRRCVIRLDARPLCVFLQ